MESNPEKSSAYLSEVGKMEGVVLSNRALYALLWTQASHKCRRLSGNDSLINTAVEYFTNTGQDELAAMSLLYKGLIHKQNKEVEHAAKAFVMSEQCFEGIENDRYKALLFNHYASLLKKQRLFRKALEYYKRSYMHEMEGDSIHYIVSACNEIALMYRVLGEPDSARAYYDIAMGHSGKLRPERLAILRQNYATFLTDNKEYDEAEKTLLECEQALANTQYIDKVYSSLATLYYKTSNYPQAIRYGEKAVQSKDSATACIGYLLLSRIYAKQEDYRTSNSYNNLYRKYHSDLSVRRKTEEVAAAAHEQMKQALEKKNEQKARKVDALMVALVILALVGTVICMAIRYWHKRKQLQLQHEKESILREGQSNTGLLRSQITKKNSRIEHMERENDDFLKKIRELELLLKERTSALKEWQEKNRHLEQEKNIEQKKAEKELQEVQLSLESLKKRVRTNDRILYLISRNTDAECISLLQQLHTGSCPTNKGKSKKTNFQSLLKRMLEREMPGVGEKVESLISNRQKQTICMLYLLGLDDMTIYNCFLPVSPETIRKYRKETLRLVEEPEHGTPDTGNLKQESDSVGPDNP
ncbi:MAG: hypothetical protein IJ467_05330 [Bacteroidaceae bacterium]|nr:hypothetical protein [Bacteroidaceae bacterium]